MLECDICHTTLERRGTRTFCPACLLRDLMTDEPDEPLEPPVIPPPQAVGLPQVPRFQLIEKLGEGGFAVVYRALQREPVRREVAVKVLKAQVATEHVLARFETERQTLARMEHPGIARLWDAGRTQDGQPFFAMELVRGEPITTFCQAGSLGLHERLALFVAVCEAVQHAHEKGVLHRDLKPSNLLAFGSVGDCTVKIIDFGIAKALEVTLDDEPATGPLTSLHQTVGTPGYMSPEQSAWGVTVVDTRSDLYALGVVLYELLTGFTPLQIERRARDESQHWPVARDISPPSKRAGPLLQTSNQRRDLDAIIMKALESDPQRRYASAAALAEDLQRHLRDEPVLAGAASWTYVMEKFARRHRPLVISGTIALLSVVAGLAVSTVLFFKEQHAHTKVEQAQRDLQHTLSRADYLTAQQFKSGGDVQSAVACLTRALRHDPQFKAAAADLQMLLVQDDTPQPVETALPLEPEWGETVEGLGAVSASAHALAVGFQSEGRQRLMLFRHRNGAWQHQEVALTARVMALELAASGKVLAVAEEDLSVRLLQVADLTHVLHWTAPAAVTALTVITVTELAAIGCADGSVWFLSTNPELPPKRIAQLTSEVSHLRLSTRERFLVAGCKNGEVWRLQVGTADRHERLLQLPGEITALAALGNSSVVAAADALGHVASYSQRVEEQLPATRLHDGPVSALTLGSTQGKAVLLSAGGARDLRVRWTDLATRTDAKPPLESAGTVKQVVMTRAADGALVVNADASVRMWRQVGEGAVTVRKPQRARFVAMSAQGRCLAVRRDLGKALEVLMLPQDAVLGVVLDGGRPAAVASVGRAAATFCADGKTLVETHGRGLAGMWDTDSASAVGVARWSVPALAMAAAPSGGVLAALADGSLLEVPTDGGPAITRVAASPGTAWALAAVSADGLAALWATAPAELRPCRVRVWWAADGRVMETEAERLASVAVHGSAQSIAYGMSNGYVRLLHGREDARGLLAPLHQSSVRTLAFNADGSALLTGSTDGTAVVWETSRLTPLTDAFRLGAPVRQVAFSGDGTRFACAASKRVLVGDTQARGLIGQAFELPNMGNSLALNHRGTRVAFSVGHGVVFVHDIAPATATPAPAWFLSLADQYVSRRMTPQGTIETLDHPGLAALRQLSPADDSDDEWQQFAGWMFTHTGLRVLTPWSKLTMEDYLSEVNQRPLPTRTAEVRRLRTLRYRAEAMGEPPAK